MSDPIRTDTERLTWILDNCEISWPAGYVKLGTRRQIDSAMFIKEYFRQNPIITLAALSDQNGPKGEGRTK